MVTFKGARIISIFAFTILIMQVIRTSKAAGLLDSITGTTGTTCVNNSLLSSLSSALSSLSSKDLSLLTFLSPALINVLKLLTQVLTALSG